MQALTSIAQVETLSLLGLEGAGRNPEIPSPTAFWHAPRKRSELMAHQMQKQKILSPVIKGTAGHSRMGVSILKAWHNTNRVLNKILLQSETLKTIRGVGGSGGE